MKLTKSFLKYSAGAVAAVLWIVTSKEWPFSRSGWVQYFGDLIITREQLRHLSLQENVIMGIVIFSIILIPAFFMSRPALKATWLVLHNWWSGLDESSAENITEKGGNVRKQNHIHESSEKKTETHEDVKKKNHIYIDNDTPKKSNESRSNNKTLYKKALLAIKYRPEAKAALDSLASMPIKFKIRFLELLEENPDGPVVVYLAKVKEEYESWLNPYENEDINIALQGARKLGNEAEKEFKEIVGVLGDSVEPKEIIKKLAVKYNKMRHMDPSDLLGILLQKYKMSTDDLMMHFGIVYEYREYVFKGKKYDNFTDALIAAEEDALGIYKKDYLP